jgi:hypothetical protein
MKQMMMKRKYILTLAATGLLLLGSCGPKLHRYSCGGKKRCISHIQTAKKAAEAVQQKTQTREV